MSAPDQPYFYRIHLHGQLSQHWMSYFADFHISSAVNPDSTHSLHLSGIFKDQAALMGTLQTLYNLGCSLISVERQDAP